MHINIKKLPENAANLHLLVCRCILGWVHTSQRVPETEVDLLVRWQLSI